MKALALLAGLAAAFSPIHPAHADLYRWVDPDTGAVKFSSYPPPWYGDPERERGAPAVDVIPSRGSPAPVKQAAAPDKPPAAAGALAALEERRAGLLKFFSELPPSFDLRRDGASVQPQIAAYQAVNAELDRLDPAGTARRRAQEASVGEALRRGLPK